MKTLYRTVAVVLFAAGFAVSCQTADDGKETATAEESKSAGEHEEGTGASTGREGRAMSDEPVQPDVEEGRAVATFAGGCFWCMEKPFEKRDGVVAVVSGFCGGKEKDPEYKEVARGNTGHTETVQIVYKPDEISYEKLLEIYWRQIDPTDADGQFVDRGSQYRPAIFYHDEQQKKLAEKSREKLAESGRFDDPIVVELVPASKFWPANDYHQNFYKTHPDRYHSYRANSGRDQFLKEHWGEDRKVE